MKRFLISLCLVLFYVLSIHKNVFSIEKEVLTEIFLDNLDIDFRKKEKYKYQIINGSVFEARNIPFSKEALSALMSLDWLEKLVLIHCDIQELPPSIGHLKNLQELDIRSNFLASLPDEISALDQLEKLNLNHNRIQFLPASIGLMSQLKQLLLKKNCLSSIPDELVQLNNLEELDLEENKLTFLPSNIGNLQHLRFLNLRINPHLHNLPSSMRNLSLTLELLKMNQRNLQEYGEGDTLGSAELAEIFRHHIILPRKTKSKAPKLKLQELYQLLDRQELSINRNRLKSFKLPSIPPTDLDPIGFMQIWTEVCDRLNLTEENESDYISYDLFEGEEDCIENNDENNFEGPAPSNEELVKEKIFPRLRGYFKTLWGLELLEGETEGWQIYEDQKQDLKNALGFILETMHRQEDPGVLSILMVQLVNAILHCPTGQKEGVDTIILSIVEGGLKDSASFTKKIELLMASKKNQLFKQAILPGQNAQNTHVLSYYFDQLKENLGLSSALPSYEEKVGPMGYDKFRGQKVLALRAFYQKFTPQYLINFIYKSFETEEDRQLLEKINSFWLGNKENLSKKEYLHFKKTLSRITQFERPFKIMELVCFLISKEKLVMIGHEDGRIELENWEKYFTHDPGLYPLKACLTKDGAKQFLLDLKIIVCN